MGYEITVLPDLLVRLKPNCWTFAKLYVFAVEELFLMLKETTRVSRNEKLCLGTEREYSIPSSTILLKVDDSFSPVLVKKSQLEVMKRAKKLRKKKYLIFPPDSNVQKNTAQY